MLNDLISLFYPNNCACCNNVLKNQEKTICMICLIELPRTNFYEDLENPIARLFWGRVQLAYGLSVFQFNQHGKLQKLIHALKYQGNTHVGEVLGVELAKDLANMKGIDLPDYIIPVPIHDKKRKIRGYNQSEHITIGMLKVLTNAKMDINSLIRRSNTDSQTKKSKYQRWENVSDVFELVNYQHLEGANILLVDDVVTTGATIESCAIKLKEIPGVKVSIAALASGT
jgi:ComF family protein